MIRDKRCSAVVSRGGRCRFRSKNRCGLCLVHARAWRLGRLAGVVDFSRVDAARVRLLLEKEGFL